MCNDNKRTMRQLKAMVSCNIGKLTAKKTLLIKSNTTNALIFFPLVCSYPLFLMVLF